MDGEFIIEQYEQFQRKLQLRQKIKIPIHIKFEAELDMMEYLILSKFEKNSNSLFKHKKNKLCDKVFAHAFKSLMDVEKIYYYNMVISHFENLSNNHPPQLKLRTGSIKASGYFKTYSNYRWKEVLFKIDFDKRYLYVERGSKLKAYDLRFYLLRKSKTTDYNSFVLQAINEVINEKGRQVYCGFKDVKIFREWFEAIRNLFQYLFCERIKNILFAPDVVEILQTRPFDQKSRVEGNSTQQEKQTMFRSTYFDTEAKPSEKQLQNRLTKSSLHKMTFGDSRNQTNGRLTQQQVDSNETETKSPPSFNHQQSINICEESNQEQSMQNCETFRSISLQLDEQQGKAQSVKDELVVFNRLVPGCQLEEVFRINDQNFLVYENDGFKVYKHTLNPKKLKTLITLSKTDIEHLGSLQELAQLFFTAQFQKQINSQIEQIHPKTILTTDYCVILYQKNKSYNRLYRARDFVFVRHIFRKTILNKHKIYIVDKSVEDNNIPPFTTIVRGQITAIYQFCEQNDTITINIDTTVQNFGYLKDMQQFNINFKFYKGFENLSKKLKSLKPTEILPLLKLPLKKTNKNQQIINLNEDNQFEQSQQYEKVSQLQKITQTQADKKQVSTYQNEKGLALQDSLITKNVKQIFQSFQKMQIQGQISTEQNQRIETKVVRKFDLDGRVLISNKHLFKRHKIIPSQNCELKYLESPNNQHPIWKGNWEFLPEGGLKFINRKQIEDQKGVLKFILSQVAKNIISGKSILNISLPVDIFSSESNLERFIFSMGYAPLLLQKAAKLSELQRFLSTVVFGMTNSPLYLEMEKPFNPIIGQTFQCYINGCPAYAQQISHHPPIAAFMLIGRGYRVSAQIQSKMKLNINSGTGSNCGVYRIRFDEGEEICYMSPSGEVSGLAYGDRKFNMIGKAYAWCHKNGFFIEIIFNPNKTTFFGKQETPIDYFQGRIYQVKESFLNSFGKVLSGTLKKSEVIKQFGKFHGRWSKQLKYDEKVLFCYDSQFPLKLEYEQSPLPSDSNWREDIAYRRILQISSAQLWKQKLQIQQRNERKLREKHTKK